MQNTVVSPVNIQHGTADFVEAISYSTFKQAVVTLHEQGKEGASEGDFHVLNRGLQILNELGALFPAYATRLADEPDFLS